MDKKEFIFPGTILGIVLIIAVGLIITHPKDATPLPTNGLATSTTTTSSVAASTTVHATPTNPTTSGSTGVVHYYPYGTTVLALNQVAGFKNAVSVRPVSVISDSRCPAEVYCIQAGTVTISLKVSANGQSTVQNIHLGETITVSGTKISFESADPARHVTSAPEPSSYRFTFTIVPAN
ncbi:MAG: hypothetical protein JWL75_384 [Parcubacteria group bacterium]|nr:hypothetical protein [Parcubacteria group bacterium]